MTASAAPKTEKRSVFGVNLEVLRIAAPSSEQAILGLSPIVFLHEGLGSVALWRDFPAQLCAATGRAGLVYSRRGYGQSDPVAQRHDLRGAGRLKPDYMHLEAWQVLPELLRLEGIERPILMGHSDGGTIALLHASRYPVQACMVMAPHLFVEDISITAITQAREAFEHGDLRQRLLKFHADVDGAFWQWNDIWLSEAFRSFNIEAQCQTIPCPLLAIQGLDDPYGSMAQIDALLHTQPAASPSPEADYLRKFGLQPIQNMRRVLLKLEQCGHSPHRDQTEKVLQTVKQWLSATAQEA